MLCLLDGVLGEFLVTDSDRDTHQLGVVGYFKWEQREQLQAVVLAGNA